MMIKITPEHAEIAFYCMWTITGLNLLVLIFGYFRTERKIKNLEDLTVSYKLLIERNSAVLKYSYEKENLVDPTPRKCFEFNNTEKKD